ncbi:hypothetical protein KKH23_03045 [Patescibacteria group bacterium]|nr:hypothetical protein [Patescibacteria group bacterium]MBU0776698.1 hypothetical protein [Patescibacteria group bacterium]MBU0846142.1 hypothetical protein [Patescibacteria group bacterium]MBU0922769.1 hypothetical protein [Patescibacteria group bacterium]MBU1066286.1 hypothetical protein [Patescibacteria group bacterium]
MTEKNQDLMLDPRSESLRRGETRERYGFANSNLLDMIDELKKWKEIGFIDKEKTQEKLYSTHERLMKAQVRELEKTLDLEMRFKNPYPYDSRTQEMWFSTAINAVRTARDEDWAEGEAKRWLDRLAVDLTWGENTQKVLEGMGGVLDKFYDWHNMLYWVRERMRSDPTASFYEGSFQKELPGMSVAKQEETSLLEEGREETREKAVKYQDECTFWIMAVAEVSQMSKKESSFMKDAEGQRTLSDIEIQFIRTVFEDKEQREFVEEKERELEKKYPNENKKLRNEDGWLIHEQDGVVPRALLNWYAMGSIEEKKRLYIAAMETLLVMPTDRHKKRTVKEALQDYIATGDVAKAKALAEGVRGWAEQGVKMWRSMNANLNQALAREVVRAEIVEDWGHFVSTRLGWGWKYALREVEENGKKSLKVARRRVGGATTVATDAISVAYWRDFIADNEGKPRTIGMFLPMSDEFRKKLLSERPDWIPEYLEAVAEKDQKLQRAFKELWEESGWDQEAKEGLRELLWYWETSYKDETGNPIVIPIFFPPEIASLNFLNTISFSGKRDIEEGDPSAWDELCAGKAKSEFKWVKMGDQALYRWMITIGQIVRYVTVMVDPESAANEGQFKDFFGDVDNIRELLKRADLGTRDEKQSKAVLTMGLVPLLISLKVADKYDIVGARGFEKGEKQKWAVEMSWWKTKLSSMPDEYGGVKGYSQGMVHLLRFYTKIFARLAEIAGKEEVSNLQLGYNETRKDVGNMGVSIGPAVVKPPPKRRYEEERR